MTLTKIFKVLVAGCVVMPATFSAYDAANAQQFVTRQNIINGLQLPPKKVNRNQGQVTVQKRVVRKRVPTQQLRVPSNSNNGKVVLRRAPTNNNQQLRVPTNNNRVVKRRAPSNNNGQVAVRRAPTQQFRAPSNNNRVVQRRAPSNNNNVTFRRAPTNNNQQLRAPKRVVKRRAPTNNNVVVQRRAPNRNPQHFNQQVASNNNFANERAIRLEERVAAYNNKASSIDLEILFDYDSARINKKSVRQLFVLGEALQDPSLGSMRVLIAGHTDAAGSNGYNANLSYLRAQSVYDFLITYSGVSSDRLEIEGYGEELLKYPDAPNSGQNRRVEIINLGG